MSYSRAMIASRAIGQSHPLSIGTAMIFEAETTMINEIDAHFLVSIPTLIRNLISSISSTVNWSRLHTEDIAEAITMEMDELTKILPSIKTFKSISFTFPSYSDLTKRYPMGKLRETLTEKQQRQHDIIEDIREQFLKNKLDIGHQISFPDTLLDKINKPTTILTGFPVDLLSLYQFPSLTLIESHTGRIKTRKEWYTKINTERGDKTVFRFPFNKFSLQLLGDGVFFLLSSRQLKLEAYALADKYKWNTLTTDGRIRQSINALPPDKKHIREALLKYL